MNANYITWNLPNWITITLMAMIGYAVISTGISFVQSKIGAA